ncbi:MAG: hypothetical protein AABY64_12395 [Bdellovibrionota bacterium]
MILITFFSTNAHANQCKDIFSRIEINGDLTLENRTSQFAEITRALEKILSQQEQRPEQDWRIVLFNAKEILKHAVDNTFQHGSLNMSKENLKYLSVYTEMNLYSENGNVFVTISNPQIKSFPTALQNEFFAGQIPDSQRTGYRGEGRAHKIILVTLRNLPTGSSVKWEANGKAVQFTLKIQLH